MASKMPLLIGTTRDRLRSWFSSSRRPGPNQEILKSPSTQRLEVEMQKSYSLEWSPTGSAGSKPPWLSEKAISHDPLASIPSRLRSKLKLVCLVRGRKSRHETHERRGEGETFREHDIVFDHAEERLFNDSDTPALPSPELRPLERIEQICQAAEIARERRTRQKHRPIAIIGQDLPSEGFFLPDPQTRLCLRGGGDEAEERAASRRRTTLPYQPPTAPRADSERPGALLWWLAGGKVSRKGKVPTFGELRVRREVERANRREVGFLGTLFGVRRVGKVGVLHGVGSEEYGNDVGEGREGGGAEDEGRSVVGSVSGSSHGSRGAGDGGVEEAAEGQNAEDHGKDVGDGAEARSAQGSESRSPRRSRRSDRGGVEEAAKGDAAEHGEHVA